MTDTRDSGSSGGDAEVSGQRAAAVWPRMTSLEEGVSVDLSLVGENARVPLVTGETLLRQPRLRGECARSDDPFANAVAELLPGSSKWVHRGAGFKSRVPPRSMRVRARRWGPSSMPGQTTPYLHSQHNRRVESPGAQPAARTSSRGVRRGAPRQHAAVASPPCQVPAVSTRPEEVWACSRLPSRACAR